MPKKKTAKDRALRKAPIRSQMAEELDRTLLDVLKNGQTIAGPDGKPVTLTPSAAMLNVIRGRLKDCGITSDASNPESTIHQLAEEARQAGLKLGPMPPVSEEPDELTG